MVVICKGILPRIAHLVPFIPCWMKWHKWNVRSIYPNFKGKFQVDIMSLSSYLEMKYSIFFKLIMFKNPCWWHSTIGFMHNWMGFSTLTYNIHTHRFGSKSTNEKSSQGWHFPTKQLASWWVFFAKWNEQIICKLFFVRVLQTIKCMSVVWVF